MDDEQVLALLAAASKGELDDDEERALLAHLQGSPTLRKELARQLIIERLLGQVAAPSVDPARVLRALPEQPGTTVRAVMRDLPQRPTKAAGWRRALLGGGALAAAAALILVMRDSGRGLDPVGRADEGTLESEARSGDRLATRSFRPASVETVTGDARVKEPAGTRLAVGMTLRAGAAIATGPRSTAVLRLPDGERLALGAGTRLRLADEGAVEAAHLEAGELAIEVSPGGPGRQLMVTTPTARIAVVGTRLRITADATRTRVEVLRGRVRVDRVHGGPGAEVEAGRFALVTAEAEIVLGRTAPRALHVVGLVPPDPANGDALVGERLRRLGFEARMVADDVVTDADARDAALIVISSTVRIETLPATLFRNMAVPLVVSEPWALDELGMTAAGRQDNQGSLRHDVLITLPEHPLAAGLSGTVEIARAPIVIGWGRPNGVALTVASFEGLHQATIFAYEKGAEMPALAAPARRIFFFLHDKGAFNLTDEGWSLFDAAVRWGAALGE